MGVIFLQTTTVSKVARVRKIAQWIKVFIVKPDDLIVIPRTPHNGSKELSPTNCPLTTMHISCHAPMCTHTNRYILKWL